MAEPGRSEKCKKPLPYVVLFGEITILKEMQLIKSVCI